MKHYIKSAILITTFFLLCSCEDPVEPLQPEPTNYRVKKLTLKLIVSKSYVDETEEHWFKYDSQGLLKEIKQKSCEYDNEQLSFINYYSEKMEYDSQSRLIDYKSYNFNENDSIDAQLYKNIQISYFLDSIAFSGYTNKNYFFDGNKLRGINNIWSNTNHKTFYSYHNNGLLKKIINPDSSESRFCYNSANGMDTIFHQNRTKHLKYDSQNRLIVYKLSHNPKNEDSLVFNYSGDKVVSIKNQSVDAYFEYFNDNLWSKVTFDYKMYGYQIVFNFEYEKGQGSFNQYQYQLNPEDSVLLKSNYPQVLSKFFELSGGEERIYKKTTAIWEDFLK